MSGKVTETRHAVIDQVEHAISIEPRQGLLARPAVDRLKSKVQSLIDSIGSVVLPETMEGFSPDAVRAVVTTPLVIRYADERYLRLKVRQHLMTIRGYLSYQTQFPPVTGAQRRAIENNIARFAEGMQAAMERLLVSKGIFTEQEITARVARIKESLLRKVGNPKSFWLTKPLDARELQTLLDEFDSRLGQGIRKVRARLANFRPGPTTLPKGADEKHSGAPLAIVRMQVLDEITEPAIRTFLARTIDPARKNLRPDMFVPGYQEISRQLHDLELTLEAENASLPGTTNPALPKATTNPAKVSIQSLPTSSSRPSRTILTSPDRGEPSKP